jgi:hypothetical protein
MIELKRSGMLVTPLSRGMTVGEAAHPTIPTTGCGTLPTRVAEPRRKGYRYQLIKVAAVTCACAIRTMDVTLLSFGALAP